MSSVIPFSFEGHEVRVVTLNDEAHWLLKQIALDVGKNKDEAIKAAGRGVMKETGIDVMGMISME